MHPVKSLVALAIVAASSLAMRAATAEDDWHGERRRTEHPAPDTSRNRTAGAPAGAGASRGADRAAGRDSDERSRGSSEGTDWRYHGGDPPYGDDPPASFSGFDLSADVASNGYATYLGVGGGKSAAYYPASSYSQWAWRLFLGARTKYFGGEVEYSHLSSIPATINSQPVNVSTETLSASLLAYLPVTRDTDLFLRYGGVNWMVNANSSSTGYAPVTSGFSREYGAGVEFRSGALFLAVEKEIFRHVYQSSFHSFTGIRLGAYIE